MTPSVHNYPTRASPGYPNTTEANNNRGEKPTLESSLTKMIEAFKEEMNESLKEIQENTVKWVKKNK
jgi:hypothetical protein